jgi:hypothetical protein
MLKENDSTAPTALDILVFAKLVPPEHSLRRVKRRMDFARLRDLVKDCDSPAMGRTAADPVRLIKLEFLPCHSNLSDREVLAAAQVKVACRCVLDVSLDSRLPVPSGLSQFRTRLGVQCHQTRCDHVVTQARAPGLVHARRRRQDAPHVLANIAVPATRQLVAQTRQRLVESARPYAPQGVAEEEAAATRLRQVTADLTEVDRLAHRGAHLRAMVAWAEARHRALGPAPVPPERVRQQFETALARAHRVLADRDAPDHGDQGRSVVAPEARRGQHGSYCDGSLLAVSLDAASAVLTALNVLAGNGEEVREAPTLLVAEEQAQGHTVQALSIDGVGWCGEVLQTLSHPQGLGGEGGVPPPPLPVSPYVGADPCTLDARGEVLTCPGGQQTTAPARPPPKTGGQCTCARRLWAGCALRASCMAALSRHKGRTVVKNDDQAEDEAARERAQTAR